jgi:hypothetical protein
MLNKEIIKTKIENIEQLSNEFPKPSPVPGFVYHKLDASANVYLKKTAYKKSVLNIYGDNNDCLIFENKKELRGEKKQTLFVMLTEGKSFKLEFSNWKCIGNIISEANALKCREDIQKIIIVTKYNWKTLISNIIKAQDVSIIVFE